VRRRQPRRADLLRRGPPLPRVRRWRSLLAARISFGTYRTSAAFMAGSSSIQASSGTPGRSSAYCSRKQERYAGSRAYLARSCASTTGTPPAATRSLTRSRPLQASAPLCPRFCEPSSRTS
jgi:hypothetical protein